MHNFKSEEDNLSRGENQSSFCLHFFLSEGKQEKLMVGCFLWN